MFFDVLSFSSAQSTTIHSLFRFSISPPLKSLSTFSRHSVCISSLYISVFFLSSILHCFFSRFFFSFWCRSSSVFQFFVWSTFFLAETKYISEDIENSVKVILSITGNFPLEFWFLFCFYRLKIVVVKCSFGCVLVCFWNFKLVNSC